MTALVEAVVPAVPLAWRVGTLRLILMLLLSQNSERQLELIVRVIMRVMQLFNAFTRYVDSFVVCSIHQPIKFPRLGGPCRCQVFTAYISVR